MHRVRVIDLVEFAIVLVIMVCEVRCLGVKMKHQVWTFIRWMVMNEHY